MLHLHEIRGQAHVPTSDVICTVKYPAVSKKGAETISVKHCVNATEHEVVVFFIIYYFVVRKRRQPQADVRQKDNRIQHNDNKWSAVVWN